MMTTLLPGKEGEGALGLSGGVGAFRGERQATLPFGMI